MNYLSRLRSKLGLSTSSASSASRSKKQLHAIGNRLDKYVPKHQWPQFTNRMSAVSGYKWNAHTHPPSKIIKDVYSKLTQSVKPKTAQNTQKKKRTSSHHRSRHRNNTYKKTIQTVCSYILKALWLFMVFKTTNALMPKKWFCQLRFTSRDLLNRFYQHQQILKAKGFVIRHKYELHISLFTYTGSKYSQEELTTKLEQFFHDYEKQIFPFTLDPDNTFDLFGHDESTLVLRFNIKNSEFTWEHMWIAKLKEVGLDIESNEMEFKFTKPHVTLAYLDHKHSSLRDTIDTLSAKYCPDSPKKITHSQCKVVVENS